MIKIMKDLWDKNSNALRDKLSSWSELNTCTYIDLVRLTFDTIYNDGSQKVNLDLEDKHIHEIDDGDYQGTLLYVIPFCGYQPDAENYIMTFIYYGSCSGCDSLMDAQSWTDHDGTEEQRIATFMSICKAFICNAIKPYNYGWRHNPDFDIVEEGDCW